MGSKSGEGSKSDASSAFLGSYSSGSLGKSNYSELELMASEMSRNCMEFDEEDSEAEVDFEVIQAYLDNHAPRRRRRPRRHTISNIRCCCGHCLGQGGPLHGVAATRPGDASRISIYGVGRGREAPGC